MIAYQVAINGTVVATAGVDEGVISCIANWGSFPVVDENVHWHAGFRVGGLRAVENGNDEFLTWLQHEMKLGDEITLRLVETPFVDAPKEITKKKSDKCSHKHH